MEMEDKKVDITKYPEGLKALADQLDLPIPPEETEKRPSCRIFPSRF